MIPLAALEEVIDASGIAPRVEAALPAGARSRQLSVRTLLAGMCLTQADGRSAHLTRVRRALVSLPGDDQRRLGVLTDWDHGPHLLTYRQTEYTFGLVADALGKDEPDGLPSPDLQAACDDLMEASVHGEFKDASASLAVDWTDLESFSRPPPRGTSGCADPEASWGHRRNNLRHDEDELFFGYYVSAGIMVPDEQGPPVPELARRMTASSCRCDPVPAFTPRTDGHARRRHPARRHPCRLRLLPPHPAALGIPGARRRRRPRPGPAPARPRHQGYPRRGRHRQRQPLCPAAPRALLGTGPLSRAATLAQAAQHDAKTAEAARYKLGRITRDDEDAYHRVRCPAAMGKVRCPLRPASMTLDQDRPEILQPPEHPPACCVQQTVTVPADVLAKTAQKHDYPSAAWRRSCARRSGAERGFATAEDPAAGTIARGWCRLTGLTPLMLFTACLLAVRNQRILAAWNARQEENARRVARGPPPEPAGAAAEPRRCQLSP